MAKEAKPQSAPRMPASPPKFLSGAELTPAHHEGQEGVRIKVRLTDYRSLPLSCVAGIDLTVDGTAVDPAGLVLTVNGEPRHLADLRERTDVSWFVLDQGELFIPLGKPLTPGAHDLEGTLHLIVPYATVGRMVHSSTSRVRLPLAEPGPVWS